MLELSCRLADDDRNDIRIEAALVKLYASELAWKVADELVQIRGGRGYETAESLAARGERPIPAEQILRDLRINRIFEGSTEIMHLLIAREAVDAHLSVAGDIIDPEAALGRKARAAARAGGFYARWLPTLVAGRGQAPGAFGEFGPLAKHLRYVERASRKLARETFHAMARRPPATGCRSGSPARRSPRTCGAAYRSGRRPGRRSWSAARASTASGSPRRQAAAISGSSAASRRNGCVASARNASRSRPAGAARSAAAAPDRRIHRRRSGNHPNTTRPNGTATSATASASARSCTTCCCPRPAPASARAASAAWLNGLASV